MAILTPHERDGYICFDEAECRATLAARCHGAAPFPHIAMNQVLPPQFPRDLLGEFPDCTGKTSFGRGHCQLMLQSKRPQSPAMACATSSWS